MDVYAVDDLLDLPSDEFFSSSSTAASDFLLHHPSSSAATTTTTYNFEQSSVPGYSDDFVDILSVPVSSA